ncbi:putative bifunctional diguanylate cyclase/phosphodiesterase [Pelomonas sp. BJYL3]|uniref:putative bifunctional diguanylate cyclase/phosphodiesterase n=1 Tax=Pelomonas sp. BJYL3 TaxID=2976697 RepID=UPI0022B3F7CF|nr:bifunctional diguanylate cyclase/phosphodiesterase [Pelomonas sp. BJYL3]
MNLLVLLSSFLELMLGVTLIALWRLNPRHEHVLLWGRSAVLLGMGLALGVGMAPVVSPGPSLDLLAGLAAAAVMTSLYQLMKGSALYRRRPWSGRFWAGLLLVMSVGIAVLAQQHKPWAVAFAATVLCLGNLRCAAWIGWTPRLAERVMTLLFVASAAVHASGPLLHPLSQSAVTHASGLIVQTLLSLTLIIVAAAGAQKEARDQALRFSRLAEHSLQGLAVMREHRLLYANPAALQMFGFPGLAQARQSDVLQELVLPEQTQSSQARHARVLADPEARIEWEGPRLSQDGRPLYLRGLSSQLVWDGAPAELIVMLDETARHEALEALRRQAHFDELTGLPNRNHAVEALGRLTAAGTPLLLASADVDRFQLINETLGPEFGDRLLHALGQRLLEHMRQCALPSSVSRLGEDQFLVLVEGLEQPSEAEALARRLLEATRQPLRLDEQELTVHLSVGLALSPRDGSDAATLLRAAESAMHRAKQIPGSAHALFDPALDRRASSMLQAEQLLDKALRAREFQLVYQPKFRCGSRRLSGFEALVRWQRPDGQRISPADFIPAAERTGQILPLGELILDIALQQLQRWHEQGQVLPVAINVSPVQFTQPRFADRLLDRLARSGLPRGLLEIEITETAAMTQLDEVLRQLEQLGAAGVPCAMDDFGTGQSSLTMLRKLPIRTLKLDRSMVEPLPRPEAAAIVEATCALGRSLNLEIVAEGVETEEQADALERLGATHLQGYLLGRPLEPAAATALLQSSGKDSPRHSPALH